MIDTSSDLPKPAKSFFNRQSLRRLIQNLTKIQSGNIFHRDPRLLLVIFTDVEQSNQVGMLQIQALRHTPKFNLQIALNSFERDFFPSIGDRKIDLTKSAHPDPTTNRVSRQWRRSWWIGEVHGSWRGVTRLGFAQPLLSSLAMIVTNLLLGSFG